MTCATCQLTFASSSTTFAISYGLSFAAIASLIVYTYLHHGERIWSQWRHSKAEVDDIHMKLMRKYPEAPTWWYTGLFVIVSPNPGGSQGLFPAL